MRGGGSQIKYEPLKTLLVAPSETQRGGVVVATENLAQYLEAQGHQVSFLRTGLNVILPRKLSKSGLQNATLRLVYPFARPRPLISALAFPVIFPIVLFQLMWFLWRQRIQIVNVHYAVDNFFYFGICRRLLPIRLVASIHGGDAFHKGRPKESYSQLFKFLLRSADLIVLPSNAYRKTLLEPFPEFGGKTIFIHNGVSPAQFSGGESPSDQALGRYVLCIADFTHKKGVDVLLRSVKQLFEEDSSLSLVLAGDGLMRAELEELADSLQIRERTHFLGVQTPAEIASLLHGCEVLALPSREESFGIVLVEAMACKKPVVASAVGGIPEIIEDRETGMLVEPDNPFALTEALRSVLSDSQFRSRLGENGYARFMKRFRLDFTGAAYEKAFASLLDCPNGRQLRPNPSSSN
jgi:glycosyltransferase involved in cell wall biosynthesis